MIRKLILWARARAKRGRHCVHRVVTFDGKTLFKRFEFLWPDEHPDSWYDRMKESAEDQGKPVPRRPHRPPWWRPFNAMLHCWRPEPGSKEGFHDHPRWTITICLQGKIIEHTPWGSRLLTPGSIVIRSRKAIHAFEVPEGFAGKTWTLFIVGRRNYRQNTYVITQR